MRAFFTAGRNAVVPLLLICLAIATRAEAAARTLVYQPIVGASPVALADHPIEPREVEQFFDGLLAGQFAAHKLAGAAIVLVKDGAVVFAKGYGSADLDKSIPVDPRKTRFTVGSISKLFVWTSVMQLVEQGRLDLDTDVNRYLKKFKIKDDYDTPVTLRALLTHSGGFEDVGTPFSDRSRFSSLGDFLAVHMPKRVLPPVTDYAQASRPYSNWGPLLAAHIVETVTGERFDQYVQRHILAPLDMASGGFQTAPRQDAAGRALGYQYRAGAFVGTLEDMTSSGPAGALIATPDDMAHFMIAHLEGGRFGSARILGDRATEMMHQRSAQASPYLNGMALGFIDARLNGRRALRHDGATRFSHSEMILFPDQRVGLFVTYNSYEGGYARPEAVKAFVNHYFPARLPRISPPAGFQARAADYGGNYRSDRRSFTTYEKILGSFPISVSVLPDGRLFAAGSRWTEVARDTFRSDAGEMLGFARDKSGRVASLNLNYSIVPATKLGWFEGAGVQALLVIIFVIASLIALIWGLKWRRWREQPSLLLRNGGWALASSATLNLLSLVLIAVGLGQGMDAMMISGAPPAVSWGLALALASVPATILCGAVALAILRRGPARREALAYGSLAAASAAYLMFLNHWNLLGFHLG